MRKVKKKLKSAARTAISASVTRSLQDRLAFDRQFFTIFQNKALQRLRAPAAQKKALREAYSGFYGGKLTSRNAMKIINDAGVTKDTLQAYLRLVKEAQEETSSKVIKTMDEEVERMKKSN